MEALDDTPSHELLCEESADSLQRRNSLLKATDLIVRKFVDIGYNDEKKKRQTKKQQEKEKAEHDGVNAYACEVLTLGLFLMEFADGVKEGDGNRIIRCWKYFLLLFKANGRKNYATEALNLLIQLNFTLSPRMAAQLKWNRTVNVHNRPGKNISSDLHMEHLNRTAKTALAGIGSNVADESIVRIGRAIKILCDTMHCFDRQHGITEVSGAHSQCSNKKDVMRVIKQLEDSRVYATIHGRSHSNFAKFEMNSMKKIPKSTLDKWMEEKTSNILTCDKITS
jgi:L1 cell adhesion molecule like protein